MAVVIPLGVPYWDERRAFSCGAQFDPKFGFYVPQEAWSEDHLDWTPRRFNPRFAGPWLIPEMLPVSTWQDNVRTRVSAERWDALRRYCYQAAGNRCEICGDQAGAAHMPHLECHEWWDFDDAAHLQYLKKLIALCPLCHKAHHLGFARTSGMLPAVHAQLKRVNGWSDAQLDAAMLQAKAVWAERCQVPWAVDISWLETYRVDAFSPA